MVWMGHQFRATSYPAETYLERLRTCGLEIARHRVSTFRPGPPAWTTKPNCCCQSLLHAQIWTLAPLLLPALRSASRHWRELTYLWNTRCLSGGRYAFAGMMLVVDATTATTASATVRRMVRLRESLIL